MFIISFQKYFNELNLYLIYFKHQFKNFYPKLIFSYYIYRHYCYLIFLIYVVIDFYFLQLSLFILYLVKLYAIF